MIIIYVHLDVLDSFVKELQDLYSTDAIKDYKISIRPKRNHIGLSIDYDDYIQIRDKTLKTI